MVDEKSRQTLMPPVSKLAEGIAWDYHRIVKAVIPTSYMNPYKTKVAPHQQGNRGTCVGQSSSSLMDYIHIMLTKEEPTGQIIRNIKVGDVAVRDQLYDQSFSAECIYDWSRKEGNVTEPAGSYCNAAIRALYKRGCCLERQWWTSKESRAVWATPFPAAEEFVIAEGEKHKIEGYAALRTVVAVKEALALHGVCIGAINIYDNYDQNKVIVGGVQLFDGNLPDPAGECVGSHALCFIGYDDMEQKLYFRHSWEGWTEFGSISYRYWEEAGGDFWVALDEHESIIGRQNFKTVSIQSNVDAKIKINDMEVGTTPYDASLEIGKTYKIDAAVNGTTQTKIITVDDKTDSVQFVFSTPNGTNIFQIIIELIKLIVGLFKR